MKFDIQEKTTSGLGTGERKKSLVWPKATGVLWAAGVEGLSSEASAQSHRATKHITVHTQGSKEPELGPSLSVLCLVFQHHPWKPQGQK